MVQTVQAQAIDLRYLRDNFGIQLVTDLDFFPEWQEDLPEVSDFEQQLLDRVQAGFINLLEYLPLLEDVVRMSVLDPILTDCSVWHWHPASYQEGKRAKGYRVHAASHTT
ncbi:MAG: hypothetical protein F6J92_39250, partial [Symploca sp. SIO1A3]|nr:hypothetical protein [Symploca sp. SIO1A3]